jgi:carbamoyl-phosphate synthase large subunit
LLPSENWLREQNLSALTAEEMQELKGRGFSDSQIGRCTGHSMMAVRARRKALGVLPAYKRVDTCAAEFEVRAHTSAHSSDAVTPPLLSPSHKLRCRRYIAEKLFKYTATKLYLRIAVQEGGA